MRVAIYDRRSREAGWISIQWLALITALAALAIAIYVLNTCCEPPPKDGGGPGTKVVRIKNESGTDINKGMKAEASASSDGMPANQRWGIGAPFAQPIESGNNPGGLGSSLPVEDNGYKEVGYSPPPKGRTWVLNCTLADGTQMNEVLIKTPGSQNGVHIEEVLARLQMKQDGENKFYRFKYDVIYWKRIGFPGSWVAQPPAMGQTTPWVPSAAN